MELFDDQSILTSEERTLLSTALDIPENPVYQTDKLTMLEHLVNGLDLQKTRKENILKYIKESLR